MSLRGTAPKRTDRGPLRNLHDQREYPLDTPVEFIQMVENTNETDVPSIWEEDSG